MNISNFLATALLNQVFRNIDYARPNTVFLALYTSDPTVVDTGAEVEGGAYARQPITFSAPSVANGKETIRNNAEIVFPIASADWGTVTHLGIRDAANGGNLLYFGPWTAARTILSGDRPRVLLDSLTLTLS
ncbi:hypothetical protein SD71_16250 [Cohnella kolymensis]|uniref:Uncharacterized protein n=1 Tax=Cohnella kolymensis TaxID=1590652 RepID=A0ABR5A292_9BACL|nr:hypothetical protein [Cohnella kolymensis]KIL35174.1 hypothetical protein SD71_16250 [Cohnella kolymensis]